MSSGEFLTLAIHQFAKTNVAISASSNPSRPIAENRLTASGVFPQIRACAYPRMQQDQFLVADKSYFHANPLFMLADLT